MIYPLLQHISLLFRFKHDGTGLPKSPGAIFFIVALAIVCNLLELLIIGDQIAPGQNLQAIGVVSALIMIAVALITPSLAVVIALVSMTMSCVMIIAGFFDAASKVMTFADITQLYVVLYFIFMRKRS